MPSPTQSTATALVAQFFANFPEYNVDKGHVLYRPGDAISNILYIDQGGIDQYYITSEGDTITVNRFAPKAFVPITAVLSSVKNSYFYATNQATTYRSAPSEDVYQFLLREPGIVLDLLTRLARGSDGILRKLALALHGKVQPLLLEVLVVQFKRFGIQENGHLRISTTHQELANISGLGRETVSRELRKLEEKHLLKLEYGTVCTKSLENLQAYLERQFH